MQTEDAREGIQAFLRESASRVVGSDAYAQVPLMAPYRNRKKR